jgi:hypothetical protein
MYSLVALGFFPMTQVPPFLHWSVHELLVETVLLDFQLSEKPLPFSVTTVTLLPCVNSQCGPLWSSEQTHGSPELLRKTTKQSMNNNEKSRIAKTRSQYIFSRSRTGIVGCNFLHLDRTWKDHFRRMIARPN